MRGPDAERPRRQNRPMGESGRPQKTRKRRPVGHPGLDQPGLLVHLGDLGMLRPLAAGVEDPADPILGPHGHQLHRSVGEVAHIAPEPELPRRACTPKSKAKAKEKRATTCE